MTRGTLPGRAAALLAAAVSVTAAAACGGSAGTSSPSTSTSAAAHTYVNPVYRNDFPDPAVLKVGQTFHAYGTQGNGHNIQTLTSTNLTKWTAGDDALPNLPHWALPGYTWAPEVISAGGKYVMYFVARDSAAGKQCIGRAVAAAPQGPFRDNSAKPLVCQPALGGSIDPDPVRAADGALYLYWKNDGNCCGKKVQLWGQRLSADGASLVGRPVALLTNTRAWQGNLIEAPEMVRHGRAYTLFYSANDYASTHYGMGYATCRAPLGPCTDESTQSLITSNSDAAGPGHCFVLHLADGRWWMIYHAWPPDAIGSVTPGRQLWLEPMTWHGNRPSVHASQSNPQPAPDVSSS